MNLIESIDKLKPHLIVIGILFIGLIQLATYMPVMYDGVFFMLENAFLNRYANIDNWGRIVGHIFFETPNLVYAYLYHPNLKTLVYLYSASVAFIPIIILLLSMMILPKNKRYFINWMGMSYALVQMSSLYFSVNEYNLAHAFVWLMFSLVLSFDDTSFFRPISFCVISVLCAFTYPYLPLTFVGISFLLFHSRGKRISKSITWMTLVISTLATLYLTHLHALAMPETALSFKHGIRSIIYNINSLLVLVVLGAVAVSLFLKKNNEMMYVLIFVSGLFVVLEAKSFFISDLYDGRSMGTLASVVILYGAILENKYSFIKSIVFSRIAVLVMIKAVVISGYYGIYWHNYKNEMISLTQEKVGVMEWSEFAGKSVSFQNANSHWNAEMILTLFQHMSGKKVKTIVKHHADFPPSYLAQGYTQFYFDAFENLGVEFDSSLRELTREKYENVVK